MKITISREFDSVEEAVAELDRISRADLPVPVKAPRKGRSDAGQPRGAYKPRSNGGPAASDPGVAEAIIPASSAAPVSPTPVSDVVPTRFTKEEAHAALKRMSVTKGLGTPACIEHLAYFGVQRFSDLPADRYPEFVTLADERITIAEAGV